MADCESCGKHWAVGCFFLFRASHLSSVSCGYLGVLLMGSSLPSVTLWCGDLWVRLWWRVSRVHISKFLAGFGIPDIHISDTTLNMSHCFAKLFFNDYKSFKVCKFYTLSHGNLFLDHLCKQDYQHLKLQILSPITVTTEHLPHISEACDDILPVLPLFAAQIFSM